MNVASEMKRFETSYCTPLNKLQKRANRFEAFHIVGVRSSNVSSFKSDGKEQANMFISSSEGHY